MSLLQNRHRVSRSGMLKRYKKLQGQIRFAISGSVKLAIQTLCWMAKGAIAYGIALAFLSQPHAKENRCIGGTSCATNNLVASLVTSNTLSRGISDPSIEPPRLHRPDGLGRCPDTPVTFTGATFGEIQLICAATRHAIGLLDKCRVPVLEPLRVHIDPEIRHPEKGEAFGMFDTDSKTVVIASTSRFASLTEGTPYNAIPQPQFYRSVVVHEVVHAILHQHYQSMPRSQAAHEYPAYALQLASLSAEVRTRLLSEIHVDAYEDIVFSDFLLAMNPYGFGVLAYKHYTRTGDGCGFIHQLLNNEATFVWLVPKL